jgi:hypothetical protein
MKLARIARFGGLFLLLVSLCAAAIYAALQASKPTPTSLAAFAPSGALLAIESPDFASLLRSWNNSPEQRRWLAGDNYAAFSRSRLFDRLGEAQDEFAATAGFAPDTKFLEQIAGQQSLLAWYDIGNLEFLYITHLPPGVAAKTPLLQLRDKFEQRSVGPDTFFVRSQSDPARTVAFAVRGDYLLLATREDLMAGALQRIQQPAERSLLHDPWYASSIAAASEKAGDLRMTLNLASIVKSPYFRSYWIQQNITELKQYTAAISDLYRTPTNLREKRVLIPIDSNANPAGADLSPVLNYLPANTGVYRAIGQPTTQQVLDRMEDKLLSRYPGANRNSEIAPTADLAVPAIGDASNLEQRIDQPLAVQTTRASELVPLRALLDSLQPTAMLVFSTASSPVPAAQTPFALIHTAVVLDGTSTWDVRALEQSLDKALAPHLTVGEESLKWSAQHNADAIWYTLDGANPIAIAIEGNICLLTSDEATLLQLLAASHHATSKPRKATTVAGFDLRSESAPFIHLTALLDHQDAPTQPGETGGDAPPFFSGNISSLASTFGDLASETFTEYPTADHTIHQTLIYQWRRQD